jgi:hypothetical protein
MGTFKGGFSPEQHVKALAAIMIESHGPDAERFARRRSSHCVLTREKEWAARWHAVADYIAATRG